MATFRRLPAIESPGPFHSDPTAEVLEDPTVGWSDFGDKLLTAHEVARRLGVPTRWVTDKCHQRVIPGYRLPGSNRLRFSWPEVFAALERLGVD